MINPEIAKLIIQGAEKGIRHTEGLTIAEECRRLRKNFFETRGVLLAWNLRNRPFLPVSEVESILHAVFSPIKTLGEEPKTKKQMKEEALARQMSLLK